MSLSNLFIERMTVQVLSPVQGPSGAVTRNWSTIARDVPCRVQPIRAQRRLELLKFDIRPTHRIYHPATVQLDERHRIVLADASVYEILAVEPAREPGRPSLAIVRVSADA